MGNCSCGGGEGKKGYERESGEVHFGRRLEEIEFQI